MLCVLYGFIRCIKGVKQCIQCFVRDAMFYYAMLCCALQCTLRIVYHGYILTIYTSITNISNTKCFKHSLIPILILMLFVLTCF